MTDASILPAAMPYASVSTTTRPAQKGSDRMWAAAQELEATFLAEMLKHARLGETPEAFGGGVGEDQFASFLRLEQARALVQAGGIGLSETLFEAMKERADGVV